MTAYFWIVPQIVRQGLVLYKTCSGFKFCGNYYNQAEACPVDGGEQQFFGVERAFILYVRC